MSINNADKGVDILLEILGQSQAIRSNLQNKENNALDTEEVNNAPTYNQRASLKSTDTDKDIILSRKERQYNQQKNEEDISKTKSMIECILNRMTEQDYKKLSEEGYKPEELTVEALSFALQVVKNYEESDKGVEEKVLSKNNKLKEDSKNISEDEIKRRVKDENLPINDNIVERIKGALKLSEEIPQMDKRDMLYIFKKGLTPSIENLYKASYSNQSNETIVKLSDNQWKELIPQVYEIVEGTEAVADNELLEDARWLIENNIPLTKDNISLLTGLEDLTKRYSKGMIFDKIIKGMKEGALPEKAILIEKEQQARVLTAKRQMEETRLKMTLEATMRLENKGIHMETKALESIVERLRADEEISYKELYSMLVAESEESSFNLLQLASESVEELKAMPIQVLGRTLSQRINQTVPDLLAWGRSILRELDKAKEAYEELFTMPRAEYGDSIKKAFSNAVSLMEEMGIDNTEYNQRAIRILGYNKMEITKESIEQVKAYDLSVNYLIENLNPGVAIQIIKDGVSPMDIPIDELNSRIEKLKEQGYSSLDKYSSYLYRLEKEEGISETERKAFIGIYRLLYQIDKSDGAALGAVIKSDQEVTLNHLLTALRTKNKGKMDFKVDDDFGVLQELSFLKETISDQLGAVFHNGDQKEMMNYTDTNSAQTPNQNDIQKEIQNAIVKELLNNLTPQRLHELHNSIQSMAYKADGESPASLSIWETIKDMPMEEMLQQIKNIPTNPSENQAFYHEKLKELQKVYSNSDSSIRFLKDFQLPTTTSNLLMAGQILNNSGTVFKRLFGLIQDKEDESHKKLQNSLKKKLELSDTIVDNESMTNTYEQLEQEVKTVIENEALKEHIDFNELTRLKAMGMQMSFLRNLAKREFYQIPLEASGKITNINLTIIRGKEAGGKVTVTLLSERLGSIRAEASLKDSKLSGYIACDYIGSLKILESQTEPLISVAEEEDISIKQLNFCLQQAPNTIYTYQNSPDIEGDKSPETERILYRLAKAMIHMVRLAEEADSAVA